MRGGREPFGVLPFAICIVLGACLGLAGALLVFLCCCVLGLIDGGLLSHPAAVVGALVCVLGGAVIGGKVFLDNRNN